MVVGKSQKLHRCILLEGMPFAEKIQNQFAEEWGLPKPTKNWDIIDQQEKKFIELKCSTDVGAAEHRFYEELQWAASHTLLVVFHPFAGICRLTGHPGFPPDEAKVKTFLLAGRARMERLGIM